MKKPQKILIIEDEPALLTALVDKFSHEGSSCLEAKNGEEGLAVALREHPDVILLDIIMPVMNGIMMLKKLIADNEWGKTVPVIILTNLNDAEKVSGSVTCGKYEYLIKSDWQIEDIVKKVKEKLGIK